MATLRISKTDIEGDRLPPVCVVCGAEAGQTKAVNFRWLPGWTSFLWVFGLLPVILGYWLAEKKLRVSVPVCGRHHGSWYNRLKIIWGGIALAVALGCLGAGVESYWNKEVGENILMGAAGLFLLMGLAAFFFEDSRVSAEEITDASITLRGLSDKFVQAMGHGPKRSAPTQGIGLQTAKYFQAGYGHGDER
jgi:hypothetical protein